VAKSKPKRPSSARRQGQQRHTATRDEKRQQFSGERKRSPLAWIAPIVVLVAIVAIGAIVVVSGSHKGSSAQAASVSSGGTSGAAGSAVKIPVAKVSDGNVHFYSTVVGGTTVKYFVVKAPDGTLRTAFDACDVCYPYKKGYRQQSTGVVQCNNCGRVFDAASIDVQRGGCNPGPITAKVVGGNLTISTAQLQAGVRFF
jgi:uncharacterized membrane protein